MKTAFRLFPPPPDNTGCKELNMYHNLLQLKDFNFVKGEWGKDLCIVTVSCWLHAVCIKKNQKKRKCPKLFFGRIVGTSWYALYINFQRNFNL